jgi:hypothetical protein
MYVKAVHCWMHVWNSKEIRSDRFVSRKVYNGFDMKEDKYSVLEAWAYILKQQ